MSVDRIQLARTQHCTCSALRRATRAVTAHYEAHFRGSELRGTQFTILSTLAQTGALSMTQLAEWLGVERTTLTRNLAVLARRGFVAYTGAKDGRVRKVEITRDGERTLRACLPRWAAAEASVGTVLRRLKLPQLSR